MCSIQEDINELQRQIRKGSIQRAYNALLSYITGLRRHFGSIYGDSAVSGLYQGFMDMTYFALYPPFLKNRDLKVAIVFNYDAFRFEAWLAARNRKVQRQYWDLFRNSHWAGYRVVAPSAGVDAIIEYDLATEFDMSDTVALTSRIVNGTTRFIEDIEKALSELHDR